MNDIAIIGDGKVVGLAFTLSDEEGEVIDQADASEPLFYLHGAGNLVDGLEVALAGKRMGDKLDVVIPPEQGYGLRQGPGPQVVPRETFPPEVELEVGMPFDVEDADGNEMELFVIDVKNDEVLIDANHPLAGVTLHFEVEVLSVRGATSEELEHGHPHELASN